MHTPLEKVVVHPASSIHPIETSMYPTSGKYRTSVRRMVEVSVPLGTSTNKSPTPVALKDCWFCHGSTGSPSALMRRVLRGV